MYKKNNKITPSLEATTKSSCKQRKNILRLFEIILTVFYVMGIDILSEKQKRSKRLVTTLLRTIVFVASTCLSFFIVLSYGYSFAFYDTFRTRENAFLACCFLLSVFFRRALATRKRRLVKVYDLLQKILEKIPVTEKDARKFNKIKIMHILVGIYYIAQCGMASYEHNLDTSVFLNIYARILSRTYSKAANILHFVTEFLFPGVTYVFIAYYSFINEVIVMITEHFATKVPQASSQKVYDLRQMLAGIVRKVDYRLNFLTALVFVHTATQTFSLMYGLLFTKVLFSAKIHLILEFSHCLAAFLVLAISASQVHESFQKFQIRAIHTKLDMFERHPDMALKLSENHVFMTLGGVKKIRRELIMTVVEIMVTYIIIVGTIEKPKKA